MTAEPTTESTFWDRIKKLQVLLGFITIAVPIIVGYVTLQNDVTQLKKEVAENTVQLKKMNDILTEQQLLNGKIIQYMQMK